MYVCLRDPLYSAVLKIFFKKGTTNYMLTSIYTIGHYNSSVTIIDLVSHTTYVVCVNIIH